MTRPNTSFRSAPTAAQPHPARRIATRRMLLHSVSATALLASSGVALPGRAAAGSFRSINAAVASSAQANAASTANAAAAQAAKQAGLGAQNVAAAAARFVSLSQALAGLSYQGPAVPDGVAPGGLQQAPGVAGSNGNTLWSGASSTLGQSVSNGVTDVTVNQTGAVASLNWQSFNIGAHTKLIFNQSAGGAQAGSWVAINTVNDPSANPTTILGEISAPGKVFILNPNGILFGAGSQLNLGSLVASTASIAQAQLTHDSNGLVSGFSLYGTISGSAIAATFVDASTTGSVVVQPGASIATNAPAGTGSGGYVLLLADTVRNGGDITTPQGQTILAAGTNFMLQPGYSLSNPASTVIGSTIAVSNTATGTALGTLGTATNSGIILADQGDVTMAGHAIVQDGVILSTTTVDTRGTVHLLTDASDATASITLSPNSVTEILPEDNGQTALDSQRAANLAASITDNALRLNPGGPVLNDYDTLPDTLGESRIEISTGGSVTMQGGAYAIAQGGQVAVNAGRSIVLQSGSVVDVSGTNAILPASENSLFIQGIVPYYLRDSAANRTGGLEFGNVYIDERTLVEITSGAYAGNIYTAGGLLEVSGNLGLVPHGIDEWTSLAGQVTLQSAGTTVTGSKTTTTGTVIVSGGSTINLTGGTETFEAGLLPQSYVQAEDGEIYNINQAPGDLVYSSVYTGDVEAHPRWLISDTFNNPLLTPTAIYQPAYTIGRDAGSLTIAAPSGTVDGTVAAGVTTGVDQTGKRPTGITDPFLLAQTVAPLAGSLTDGIYEGGSQYGTLLGSLFASNVLITGPGPVAPGILSALPDTATGTIAIDGAALTADGFASVTIYTEAGIAIATPVSVASGGIVTFGAELIEDAASVTAHAGAIVLSNFLPTVTGTYTAIASTPGSITLAAGATLDATGLWTNLARDPADTSHEGYAAGGSITVLGNGPVDLQAGATLEVSSGGIVSTSGKLTAEAAGSITVSADMTPLVAGSVDQFGAVTYAAQFRGYASGSGGTLSLTAPEFILGSGMAALDNTVIVDPALLSSGFGDYVLNGVLGLYVTPGTPVSVTRPVYVLSDNQVPTGAPASDAYSIVLPDLFTQTPGKDSLTQRAGASLSLDSTIFPGVYNGGGYDVTVGQSASVTVDPGQSITVAGYNQVTVLGTLTAHGGTITVANTRYEQDVQSGEDGNSGANDIASNFQGGLSVWIGDGAVIDASGVATVMTDGQGRRFGQGQAGGSILLGGLGGADTNSLESTYAQVIVRPGAVLNASGASASVDVVPSVEAGNPLLAATPITLSGAGGTIVARSYDGVALDGTMLAAGAGPGAAGGSLMMRLDPQALNSFFGIPLDYIEPEQILVTQAQVFGQPGSGIEPGSPTDPVTYGIGRISQAQIDAGGFDSVHLYAQDNITFEGDVTLSAGRSLILETPILGDVAIGGTVTITAPYIGLIGYSKAANGGGDTNGVAQLASRPDAGALTIDAAFIDIANEMDIGGTRAVGREISNGQTLGISYAGAAGFANTTLNSAGDVRFDYDPAQTATENTIFASSGNIMFRATQLYPVSLAAAEVIAGENPAAKTGSNQFAGGTLTIESNGVAPEAPFSADGTLSLAAGTIVQDGVVSAPEGVVAIGLPNVQGDIPRFTQSVTLGAGSVTSVSLDGQTVPFGGTVDGVNYLYDGVAPKAFTPSVSLVSTQVDVDPGAIINLRGGGTLSGAGFVAGRGGTADVNKTPLLNSASGTVADNTSDPVFAILPGDTADYAPVALGDAGYDTPAPGAQITIRAGEVPGLAAGTYTLLPAYYDLLPGGYRVELTGAPMVAGTAINSGNFTIGAAVTLGTANTGISAATPTEALITSGAGVRQLSQYDEESYNQFAVGQAATFDSPRPLLPQDAKTLEIEINAPSGMIASNDQPFSIDAGSLLKAPAAGGYGATLEITAQAPIEILAPGEPTQFYAWLDSSGTLQLGDFGIGGAMLSALAVPRLVIGGTLTADPTYANQVDVQGSTPDVLVLPGATLSAGDIMLTTANYGTIHVEGGATLTTAGAPATAYGLAQGLYFNSDDPVGASPVVALSNVQDVFTPNAFQASGASIAIDSGASLAAGRSLDFNAPQGTAVQIGDALLTAPDVTVQVPDINIGSTNALAAFASILPSGLTLDAAALQTLAQNAQQLSLTGDLAVNIIGSVTLDSGKTDLVLNTPAIYGYGIANAGGATVDNGSVAITAPSFTWSGVATQSTLQTGGLTTISAVPGGRLAGSAGSLSLTRAARLTIAAGIIDLGDGPDVQVDDQVVLNRVAYGFDDVSLQASTAITANNQSSLSAFSAQRGFGGPGVNGNLTLVTPLVTAASGAVLDLTAGGTLSALAGSTAPAATGTIATLGATIHLTADVVSLDTALALPSGKLTVDAADGIDLGGASVIDLSGRQVHLFDQTVISSGGTLLLEADAATTGSITQEAGGVVNVSSPGANAGSVAVTASGGAVQLDGTLLGGTSGSSAGAGSFSVFAGMLASGTGTGSAFDALNSTLDAGGFTGARNFELATGDIVVDQSIAAHTVTIATDEGNIDIAGTIDASGAKPGSIALSANGTLTLEQGAVLDAHATATQVDSYGAPIDAENRAHVTLTAQNAGSLAGSIVLMAGATIDVGYPGAGSDPQGEVVINAPRVLGGAADTDSVAVSAPGSLTIKGAESIALYGFATYSPADPLGTIVQDNGTGDMEGSYSLTNAGGTLGIVQIGLDSQAYISSVDGNAGLGAQLAGLIAYGSVFHLRPGAMIESTATSGGNLTISGDLDFSGLRFSDPVGFGSSVGTVYGSGEPGAVVFRAGNDLTVNGSVTDGFLPPPDETSGTTLTADGAGWNYRQQDFLGGEITNADLLLPAGAVGGISRKLGASTRIVLLGSPDGLGTAFDVTRPISLNYAIVINSAQINPNVVIPFALTVGMNSDTVIPAGGWVATAPVTRDGMVLFGKGQLMPAGFTLQTGDVLGAGTVLPVSVSTGIDSSGTGQTIPAGTNFDIFSSTSSIITLAQNTAVLQPNALIPSNTYAVFGGVVAGTAYPLISLALRQTQDIGGNQVQGYLYPLAQLLPAGSQSWSMNFVAGANLGAANLQDVQPLSTLNGGVFAPAAGMTDAAPGSLLLDDQHYYRVAGGGSEISLAFSVIRTGTGDLSLVAGGDVDQSSLYGIYTAGTQVPLGNGNDAQFDSARQTGLGQLLNGRANADASALIEATYQAYYPGGGGDVLFAAQGNVTGDIFATTNNGQGEDGIPASDAVGNWLWRQGSTQLGQPTAWWINYGTLVDPLETTGLPVQMVGFQGIGALGGGDVTVAIGGNAGQTTDRDIGPDGGGQGNTGPLTQRGEGLIVAVGSTGRILPGTTTPVETGGGDITVTIGGTLNPIDAAAYGIGASQGTQSGESPAVNGDFVDTRGNIAVTAGAIGRIDPVYNASAVLLADPRALDPFTAEDGIPNGGVEILPGDGAVSISTLRDLVLAGAADPGRVQLESYTDLTGYSVALTGKKATGGDTGFTLWQPGTSVDLFSAGGNVAPTTVPNQSQISLSFANDLPTDYRSIYPANLFVTAATGDIIYGQYGVTPAQFGGVGGAPAAGTNTVEFSLETMPSANGEVSFLAGGSINANDYPVDLSGANPAGLSLPTDPAFLGFSKAETMQPLTNILSDPAINQSPLALFALQADTPTTNLHADDVVPARFYAAGGDIIDFQTGETLSFVNAANTVAATWYIAAKPAWIIASQDIVSSGTRPAVDPNETLFALQENNVETQLLPGEDEYSSGNLFLNNTAQSISVIQAGRDILSSFAYTGGPGLLDIQAGRNIYQASELNVADTGQVLSFGAFKSLGDDLIAGSPINLSGGANIAILAGVGTGIDATDFANLYFNPDNQANLSIPLTDPANEGKVQLVYTPQLVTWLATNYGYTGDASGALAAFLALPAIDQDVFVRQVFFEELQASGAQESNPASRFYKSYARGRLAIDTLLPSTGKETVPGDPVGYSGAITMYSGTVLQNGTNAAPITDAAGTEAATFDGGVATLFGGTVQVIDPGGQATFGVPGGPAPGNNSGIVTYGSGDVDIYALDDVLLGKSRIFTTAGGNITIWSSAGSINAGIGAKTTQVYNPPVLVYDDVGDVTDTPPAVSTGAGIATLQPLPDVPAGDVTLIAPLGTIDAGEAGIRVSGNLVLAAARVVGTANISVKGSTQGAPTVNVASLGAVEAAGAAAGASTNAAQSQANRSNEASDAASVLDVEVISIGGTYDDEKKRREKL